MKKNLILQKPPYKNNWSFIDFLVVISILSCSSAYADLSFDLVSETEAVYSNTYNKSVVIQDESNSQVWQQKLFPSWFYRADTFKVKLDTKLEFYSENGGENEDAYDSAVHELYIHKDLGDSFGVRVGKQHLNWGSGQIWNPTNIFRQRDYLSLDDRLEGVEALSLRYIRSKFNIEALTVSAPGSEEVFFGVKVEVPSGRITSNLTYMNLRRSHYQIGLDINYGGDLFTFYSESVFKNHGEVFEFDEVGSALAASQGDLTSKDEFNLVFGGGVILSPVVSTALEYNYRSNAASNSDFRAFEAGLPLNVEHYDELGIGKNRLYLSIRYRDEYGYFSYSMNAFYDADSYQTMIYPSVTYSNGSYSLEFKNYFFGDSLRVFNSRSLLKFSMFF